MTEEFKDDLATESPTPAMGIEEKAKLQGWRPLDEFHGDRDMWVDAKEFMLRGSFIREIKNLKDINKTMLDTLKRQENERHSNEQAYIRRKLADAEEVGDLNAYKKAELDMAKLQEKAQQAVAPDQGTQFAEAIKKTEEYEKFKIRNPWIEGTDEDSAEIQEMAQFYVNKFVKSNPNASRKDAFDYIHSAVRKSMPDKFKTDSEQPKPSPVLRSGGGKISLRTDDNQLELKISRLPREHQKVAKYILSNEGEKGLEVYLKAARV